MKKPMIHFLLAVCGVGGVGFSAPSVASEVTEAAMDFRQSMMTTFKWYVQPMGEMVKGDIPFDAALFKSRAAGLASATRLDVTEGFLKDSVGESNARPEIWMHWDDFQTRYQTLQREALNLKGALKGG